MFIKLSLYLVQLLFFNKPINCTNNIRSMMCKIYLSEYKLKNLIDYLFALQSNKSNVYKVLIANQLFW